jgi:alpha-L-fucosidase 2
VPTAAKTTRTPVIFAFQGHGGTMKYAANKFHFHTLWPAAIGLDSDPKLLQICRHTIDEMGRWTDNNGFSSWYTACARIGYDPKTILAKLREECDKHSLANLLLFYGGGGVESCGGFLAINEMLLQSNDGLIRLFPCWPKDQDARFGTLRAVGAFLISAELKHGAIGGVTIVSEKGKACTLQNPWPGKTVRLVRNGKPAESVAGERLTLGTTAGEVIEFKPE